MVQQPAPQPIHKLNRRQRVWKELARTLSTVFNPFLTGFALFIILAHSRATSATDFWWLLFLSTFFTSLGPMLYVFWLYATDRISDLDMSIRAERERVFGVFVVSYLAGTCALYFLHAPKLLVATMAGYTLSAIVVQYITRYWKISTHALGITAPLVALWLLYGRQPLPFLVLIPLVCWARVHLKAHTVSQVIAGAALGASSVALFFWLFRVVSL
ncbi:MAG: phosphatase PAP2 family protein [Candidatus Eremiobacteraeota bacterium]|nr:phosphatase PAP2 family protein [Candidatus Eremiobacteraeota bacterium]